MDRLNELFDIRVLGDLISDGVFICDKEGYIQYVNEKNEKISGIRKEDCIGKHISNFINTKSDIKNTLAFELLNSTQKYISMPASPAQKGKILEYGAPVLSKNGEKLGAIIIDHDISQLLELEDILASSERKLNKLENINAHHEQIIDHLSHRDFSKKITKWNSKSMQEITGILLSAAKTDATILLQGETGVGKEVFAREIMKHSQRSKHPFISINCAAIPNNLIESELFGYEKGSFTGANPKGKPGTFELAHQGTLFLDEIGEIPLDFQVKLLRAIQEKEITRIGSSKPIHVDFRLIVATNQNLQEKVSNNEFRSDLFYRLNVIPLNIPPLRERPEDIALLFNYFSHKFSLKYKKTLHFNPAVLSKFTRYSWPGNIREMENLMERWYVLYPDGSNIGWTNIKSAFQIENDVSPFDGYTFTELMENYEREILIWSIHKYGSLRKAAAELDIHYSTLSKMSKRLNIDVNSLKMNPADDS